MQKSIVEILSKGSSKNELSKKTSQVVDTSTKDKSSSSKLLKLLSNKNNSNRVEHKQTSRIHRSDDNKKRKRVIETKPCPLCGRSIKLNQFEEHIQQELKESEHAYIDDQEDDDNDSWHRTLNTDNINAPPQHTNTNTRHNHHLPNNNNINNNNTQITRAKPKVVYVLGGEPEVTASRNPKKRLPQVSTTKYNNNTAYNYYDDGGGELDADELGFDGTVGIAWEGVGATTY